MTPSVLLDGNVLVAPVIPDHVHHARARTWFPAVARFATCPTVQGTLLRLLLRQGTNRSLAREALAAVVAHPRHEQWLDDLTSVSYTHLRAHETRHDLVCRLLLEKKK